MKRRFKALMLAMLMLTLTGCRRRVTETAGISDIPSRIAGGSGASGQSAVDAALPPETRWEATLDGRASEDIGTSGAQGANLRTEQEEKNRVTVAELSDAGGEAKPADEGGTIGLLMDAYNAVLEQGLGTLYECKIISIYWEQTEDYVTVNLHSPEHQLILDAGGYNLAEKRGDDKLTIDDAWILRKNPALLVKLAPSKTLGAGVSEDSAARAVWEDVCARPGWRGVSAVLNGRVLLLSESLLDTDAGQLCAKLYLAKAMYPDLFQDVDADAVCEQLMGASGQFAYPR